MKLTKGKISLLVLALLLLTALLYAFAPKPVKVELQRVERGPLQVLVQEDGRTRIKDRYVVSSPLAGQLARIHLKPGHKVEAGKTLIATVQPPDPQLLDPRAVATAQANVKAAEATMKRTRALLDRAQADLRYATNELARAKTLFEDGTATQQELDQAEWQARTAEAELDSAQFAVQIAEFEMEQARAALLQIQPNREPRTQFEIQSPINGKVLRVFQESSAIVSPGTALLELGDPSNLEVEIDVLSSDAVSIPPDAKVILEYWGGPEPLEAQVRLVEPAGFTKISALGVEEQRVWVIADFVSPRSQWENLGDAYRVEAKIVTWESEDVLKVPNGALFRRGKNWNVFVVENEIAQAKTVSIGHRGEHQAEVLTSLSEGDLVIKHPSDQIQEGVEVVEEIKN